MLERNVNYPHTTPAFYADTSKPEHIQKMIETGLISGITTNPGLFFKDNPQKGYPDFMAHIKNLAQEFNMPVSVQLPESDDIKFQIELAEEWKKMHDKIVIKVPCFKDGRGFALTGKLTKMGIGVNVTGLMSCYQVLPALIAGRVGDSNGPTYVSLFYRRIGETKNKLGSIYEPSQHGSSNSSVEIGRARDIIHSPQHGPFNTLIIAGSLRVVDDVFSSIYQGADIATIPFPVFEKMMDNPMTQQFINESQASWNKLANRPQSQP